MPTPEDLETSALASLKIGSNHRRKSNDRAELTSLGSAARTLLAVSVARYEKAQSGVEYLRSHDVGTIVRRMAQLNSALFQALLGNDGPPSKAVDNEITPVHIGWLVHEWEAADTLLAICNDGRVARYFPLGKFWAEYHRAIQCLVSRQPYEPLLPKLRGYERCWVPYLNLIADLTHGRDPGDTRKQIAEAFAKRNRDKRLTDWQMIDGDGRHPVKWDFREVAILEYHNRAK